MYGYCIVNVIFSVVKNDADPDQTCYFDANPAPGLDYRLASNADLSPSFTHFEKLGLNFFTFIHSNGRLKYISFHMSGKCVMILIILDSLLKFLLNSEKYMCLELAGSGSACPGYQS
jgi:hypothetical protein